MPRVTPILASDIESLRTGVNRLRSAAGVQTKSYATIQVNDVVQASHFTELQTDINDARALLGRPAFTFKSGGVHDVITAQVIQELREAVCACGELNLKQATE